ncbi:MAG: YmdB family metallophosphoesterase [Deltaproteobacteria bacterium]|nr:YmdB family metallophosphoesterase [Deltaproteobacteria bacterium]
MKILFIGDIFGEVGKKAVLEKVPLFRLQQQVDFVIANGENVSKGKGIKIKEAHELFDCGVDVITSGNHAFDQDETEAYFRQEPRFIHPANYNLLTPSKGWVICEVHSGIKIGVINLAGQIFMSPANCPFECVDRLLKHEMQGDADIVIVDMHADASSECRAMGWHLEGRVAAVLGTHMHVQTADEEILPGGTAYITDVGMTGPYRSVIGMSVEGVLKKFRTGMKQRYIPASEDVRFCALLLEVEENTGKATSIQRIQERMK